MIEINLLQLLIQCRLVKLSFNHLTSILYQGEEVIMVGSKNSIDLLNHLIPVSPHAKRVAGEGK